MNPEIFIELAGILVITALITGIMKIFKQPEIIGYILSGVIAGPFVLNMIEFTDTFRAFSQIGIALLLFFVGINLNPRVIKDVGKTALITGLGQVIFTTTIGMAIAIMFGFSFVSSLYIGIALAFSSTIIIMKLLTDKRDLDSLYGRISVGFLIVQDFVAIFILLVLSSLNNGTNFVQFALDSVLKGVGAIIVIFLITLYILPSLTKKIAKSQEYLLLFSITWCFAIASIFYYLNFSIEAGALLAGITLSLSPYHLEISSKLKPLRDFFLILFFIMLGSQMVLSNILDNIGLILGFSFFVLLGNPIIVMMLMGLLGYTKRTGFLSGLTVAQISEFSLIVLTMGVSMGFITSDILSLVTVVGLITFAGSTYMILFSEKIYRRISGYLSVFERGMNKKEHKICSETDQHDIIIFGYNNIGYDILESLNRMKKKVLIVDYNPDVISKLSKEGYDCRYGDANDFDLLNELNICNCKMIISTISALETNLLIIGKVNEMNESAIISVVSHDIDDALMLYEKGATYVIMPHFLGGKYFSTMIENNSLDLSKFLNEKIRHVEHIKHRKMKGYKHPKYDHK